MSEIYVHLPTETVFVSGGLLKNGEGALFASSCLEKKDANTWEVELVASVSYQSLLKQDYILYLKSRYGYQPFRVNNPEIIDNKIKTIAKHVCFDLKNYYLSLSTVIDLNCQAAMQDALNNTYPTCPFTVYSDIPGIATLSTFEKSLYDANVDIASQYGGYLDFDHFQIRITGTQGEDLGETIEYGKNLEGAAVTENWDNVVTDLLPVGNNGLMLPEGWLHSEIVYDQPYTKRVEFDTDTEENLRFVATLYIGRYEVPNINYNLKSNAIQNVKLGDVIAAVSPRFTIKMNVVAYENDVLLDTITQVEFGNYRVGLKQKFGNLRAEIENSTLRKAQFKIDEVNGKIILIGSEVTIQIRDIQTETDEMSETVQNVRRNIVFDESGVTIGKPDSSTKTNMDYDGVTILEGDEETFVARGQQVVSPSIRAKYSLEIGSVRHDDYNGAWLVRKV
ncbi:MAG TPA: hypothetical protein DCQ90_06415 [Erysipelotrichaceae bacterium]|nr:hypothetical protein [Erysipelotrichaceae bacterium]